MRPGGPQLLVILFIVLLLFGSKRLPELASSLGESLKQLRKASEDDDTNDGPTT